MDSYPLVPSWVSEALREGLVIPAHPLALTREKKLDERRQRALTRYYHAAGAGGIAVGVHTTQFEIRDPKHGLLAPVLKLAASTVAECDRGRARPTVRIAGICGRTEQALAEARIARECGYHLGLLSLTAFPTDPETVIVEHCQAVAREIAVMGFYLQPAVGGRALSVKFWRQLAEIPNLLAIKIAAFNRYHTLDVVRAVAETGRAGEIALYTGNDDNIVVDLITEFQVPVGGVMVRQCMVGGLLGHWACWTAAAVDLLRLCKEYRGQATLPSSMLTLAAQVTDCNAAVFDAANEFSGCIAGIHEVLRRQGLLNHTLCLDSNQVLSPGQMEEIDRVYASYPELNDDAFVKANLANWLGTI